MHRIKVAKISHDAFDYFVECDATNSPFPRGTHVIRHPGTCGIVRNMETCFSLLQNSNNQVAMSGQNQVSGAGDTQGGPNTVLRVIVEHMLYPISLDMLYQVSAQRATRCTHITDGSFIISSFRIESSRSRRTLNAVSRVMRQ